MVRTTKKHAGSRSNCSAVCAPMQTRGRPQQGQSFSASVRSWTTSRRGRCSGKSVRPWGVAWPGLSFLATAAMRSERRPKRCCKGASSLPRNASLSARKRATSTSSSRTSVCRVGTSPGSGASGVREEASMPVVIGRSCAVSKGGSGRRVTFETLDAREVNAVEDHLELAGAQLDAGTVRRGRGEVVAARLKALAPQAQAVSAPVEDLKAVGCAVAKDEQVAGERVGLEAAADQGEQAVEAQPHIDGLRTEPEFDGRWQGQHGASPRAVTRERTQAVSQPGGKRRTAPVGKTSSTAAAGCCSV